MTDIEETGTLAASRRIVLCPGSGGAAIAARQLAEVRHLPTLELGIRGPRQRVLQKVAVVFNLLFRQVGEDFIWPAFLSLGHYRPAPGDELHWVLCPGFNLAAAEDVSVTIYMHDEWWCSGWEAYEVLEPHFECGPGVMPGLRLLLRNWFANRAKKRVRRVLSRARMVAPSIYLAERCLARGLPGVEHDSSQAAIVAAPPRALRPPALRSTEVMFYAPQGSWKRKGSDLTAAVAQAWAVRSDAHAGVFVGGFPAPTDAVALGMTTIGAVAHDRLMVLLEDTRLVVFMTRNDNLPNIVGEAIGRGARVLTTPNSGAQEFRGGDVLVTNETDPDALAALIKEILAENSVH